MKINSSTVTFDSFVIIVFVIVSVLLLLYTGYRAAVLSFTIDESISYNVFVPLKFMGIVSYKIASSNHHMINTLCMKIMSLFFGNSEFSLRFPSLVSHSVYIIFTYKLFRKISSSYFVLPGFLLLNLNPYLLDFFSLARGYAMAVAFTVISVYFLLTYIESHKEKNVLWCLVFGALAVLSNFSLLIYFVSLIVVVNFFWIASQNKFKFIDLFRKNYPVIICGLLLVLIMFEPIRKLIKYKEFYDGGLNGFWSDTVGSLISATLYDQPYLNIGTVYLEYFIGISSVIMLLVFVFKLFFLKWKVFSEKAGVVILLLFLPCIVSMAQHYILKSNYLINRMALFLIPLFFVSIFIFIDKYAIKRKWKIFYLSLVYILAGAFTFHTINSINTSSTLYWKFDADTKTMLNDLVLHVKEDSIRPVKLGVMSLYEPAINFYRQTRKYDWLEKVTEDGYREQNYNYYYLGDSSMNFIKSRNLIVIKHYQTSKSCLVKQD